MINNLIKQIPLTTIIISYFFICGGLYLIGFWSTFNVDISNLISITDIPKSFIYPFVISQGYFIVFTFINFLQTNYLKDELEDQYLLNKKQNRWKRVFKALTSPEMLLLLFLAVVFKFYPTYNYSPSYWMLSSFIFAFLISTKYENSPNLKTWIPYTQLRKYIVRIVISIPLISYGIGKANSLDIYNDKHRQYVNLKIHNTHNLSLADSNNFKFVGFIGDKLIVSSKDNRTLTFINQSSIEQLQILNEK